MAKKRQIKPKQQPPPPKPRSSNKLLLVSLSVVVLGTGWVLYSRHRSAPMQAAQMPAASRVSFGPTVPNAAAAPGPAPQGMAWIPGGEFSMGAQDPPEMDEVGMKATVDSRPIHRVYVDGFYMDKTDVTNSEFAKFVKATGYVTV